MDGETRHLKLIHSQSTHFADGEENDPKRECVETITEDALVSFGEELDAITAHAATRVEVHRGLFGGVVRVESVHDEEVEKEMQQVLRNIIHAVIERGVVVGHKLGLSEERETER